MPVAEIQIGGNCYKRIQYFFRKITIVYEKSLNFGEQYTFLRIMRKICTLSERGRHFCEFCEKDARFPRVEFVGFLKIGPQT